MFLQTIQSKLALGLALTAIATAGSVLSAAVAGDSKTVSLPANYPVPIYPGAQTTSFSGGSMTDLMSLISTDGIDRVVAWYQSPKGNWQVEGSKKDFPPETQIDIRYFKRG